MQGHAQIMKSKQKYAMYANVCKRTGNLTGMYHKRTGQVSGKYQDNTGKLLGLYWESTRKVPYK